MLLTLFYLFLFSITTVHAVLIGPEVTEVPLWTFFCIPLAMGIKTFLRFFKFRDDLHYWPNRLLIPWVVFIMTYQALFFHHATGELIFLFMFLFGGFVITEIKHLDKLFGYGGAIFLALLVYHTYNNSLTTEATFPYPSEMIATFGTVAAAILLKLYLSVRIEELDRRFIQESMKSTAVTNLLLGLGHILRTPLSTVRLKTEFFAFKEGMNQNMEAINKDIDGIIKLFTTFEKAIKPTTKNTDIAGLLESVRMPIKSSIVRISKRDVKLSSTEFTYFSTVLNILADNAKAYGTGDEKLIVYVRETHIEFAVENKGDYFQPNEFRDKDGKFTPDIARDNNRIGTSLITAFALCEALHYIMVYKPLMGGGTRVEILPEANKES